MNRPTGVWLLAVLFWGFAVYCLWSGIAILITFGIGPLISPEPSTSPNVQIIFTISEIVIGILLIVLTVYFRRIGFRIFRVDESVRIPAIKSLIGVLLFCALGLVMYFNASRHIEFGMDYSILTIAGLAIVGLSYLLSFGKKHFEHGESEPAIQQT